MSAGLQYASVCSGIESASVAWEPLGFHPLWFSEIATFPSAVLAHRWPQVANLGDMTLVADMVRAGLVSSSVDVLVGGMPCQPFSFTGLRRGISDPRGQLTTNYVDIINAIDIKRPENQETVCLWENVPGILSSRDNAFGHFLGALVGSGSELLAPGGRWRNAGCVFGPQRRAAWRTFDSQHFGVPQRRRRVFLVASARRGLDPRKILFESAGVRRDIVSSCKKTEGVTAYSQSGFGKYREGVGTLRASTGSPPLLVSKLKVRKFTPREWERLQGFPDDYTRVPYQGRPVADCPDLPRYRALGNTKTVPVIRWIGARVFRQLSIKSIDI